MTQPETSPTGTTREHVLLDVEGMHCAACVARVERALAGVPGGVAARVNLVTGQAAAELEPGHAGPEDLVAALIDAANEAGGYDNVTAIVVDAASA